MIARLRGASPPRASLDASATASGPLARSPAHGRRRPGAWRQERHAVSKRSCRRSRSAGTRRARVVVDVDEDALREDPQARTRHEAGRGPRDRAGVDPGWRQPRHKRRLRCPLEHLPHEVELPPRQRAEPLERDTGLAACLSAKETS